MSETVLTSVDVYDAASSIGLECQAIINQHGPNVLENLMPKVISVLEELEACALYREKEDEEVRRLRTTVEALRMDCHAQTELKEKLYQSLEQLEHSWYSETQQLLEQITELENENNRLAQELASGLCVNSPPADEKLSVKSVVMEHAAGRTIAIGQKLPNPNTTPENTLENLLEEDISDGIIFETEERLQLTEQESRTADLQLIGRLKECAAANFKAMRNLNRDILYTNLSLDAAEEEACRLARQTGKLRAHKVTCLRPLDELTSEKTLLEQQLQSKEREVTKLQQLLQQSNEVRMKPLGSDSSDHVASGEERFSSTWMESGALECSHQKRRCASVTVDHFLAESFGQHAQLTDSDGLTTLEELRHLLYERNDLKCRLIEIEEQLSVAEQESTRTPEPQGPLPLEPIEKLRPGWPEKPSIRTMFRKMLTRLTDTSSE